MKRILFYLYVKESPCGLKYLGQTTRNPFKYKGSGVYWKRYLKSHKIKNIDLKTTIIFETYDEEELIERGIYYSKLWNIVESEEWANLCYESGGSSTLGAKSPEHVKKAILEANGIKIKHKETGEIFNSIKQAADSVGMWKTTLGHYLFWAKDECKFEYLENSLNKDAKERKTNRILGNYHRDNKDLPNKSSKFVGVHYDKSRNKWQAKIRIGGSRKYLGRFNTEKQAAKAYQRALKEYKKQQKQEIV